MRQAMVDALLWADLADGKGAEKQQKAYQELEWRRCLADPVYWMERYGRLWDKETGRIVPWDLWPVQKDLVRTWYRHESSVAVKARQLGITVLSAHYALWEVIFKDAAKWLLISASEDKAKDIIDRVQATKDNLPQWMVERALSRAISVDGTVKRKDRSDALMRISYGLSEMKVVTSTSQSIKGAAANFILDEFTEHSEQERKWRMLLPALDGGAMAIIIANGEGEDTFYHVYQQAKVGVNKFKPYFFWWADDPRRLDGATVVNKKGGKTAASWFSRENLMKAWGEGRVEAPWYEEMKRQYLLSNPEQDEYAFKQQFPSTEEEAFYISGNSRFGLALMNQYMQRIHADSKRHRTCNLEREDAKYVFRDHMKGGWRVYEEPIPGCTYVLGVDSSGGQQTGDYATIQVLKEVLGSTVRGEQVAVYQAKIEPAHLAYEVEKAGRHYNDAFVVVEVNFHGGTVRDKLKDGYWNLYMRKRFDMFSDDNTDSIGWWADSSSKAKVVDQLAEWLHGEWLILHDSPTVTEMARYEIKDNGRSTGAPKGQNDDLVSALYLAVEGIVDRNTSVSYEPITHFMFGRAK